MTTFTFTAKSSTQFVDWSDPSVWSGGVVPNAPDADVIFPTVTRVSDGSVYVSFVTIGSSESFSVNSVSLTNNDLLIDGALSVANDFAIHQGGEIDMAGGLLTFGSLQNDGTDIQGHGQIDSSGILTNDTLIVGNGLELTLGGLVNSGRLAAASGDLTVNVSGGGFANLSGGTLTGGTYGAGFQQAMSPNILFMNVGGVVTTDAATIQLDKGGEIEFFDPGSASYVPIEQTLQTIAPSGTLSLANQTYNWAPLTIDGALLLSGTVTLNASQLTVDSGGTISFGGLVHPPAPVNGSGKIAAPIDNDGTITVSPPSFPGFAGTNFLDIAGPVTGSGVLVIGAGADFGRKFGGINSATLELGGPASENVVFQDGIGTLQLDDFHDFSGNIAPPASGDQIILTGVSFNSLTAYSYAGTDSGGTLTLQTGGTPITLDFLGDFNASNFSFSAGPQALSTSPPSLLITMANVGLSFAAGDFDSDGDNNGDLLWHNPDGSIVTWDMNGAQTSSQTTLGQVPSNWDLIGTGHFSGLSNGVASNTDVLLQSDTGGVVVWQTANGHVTSDQFVGQVPGNWHVVGIGDFNGDGKSDVLWQSDAGGVLMWGMDGPHVVTDQMIGQIPSNWRIVGVGDVNGDGKSDVLLHSDAGGIVLWEMNGTQAVVNQLVGQLPPNWHFAATGDFNGDGKTDILFHSDSGGVVMWEMNGTQVLANQFIGQVPLNWSISGTADLNGDGKSDVIWTNGSGAHQLWEMSGTQVIADQPIGPNGTPASPPLQSHVSDATPAAADSSVAAIGLSATMAADVGGGPSAPNVNVAGTPGDHVGGIAGTAGFTDTLSSLINHDQHFLV